MAEKTYLQAISDGLRQEMRRDNLIEVSGKLHFFTIFDLPFAVCCIATMTRLDPVTRSMAPPMPGTIFPGIIQFARCPPASTCKPPSTVMST